MLLGYLFILILSIVANPISNVNHTFKKYEWQKQVLPLTSLINPYEAVLE